ncbi:TauD/TfdA family dioxygenase [Halieaceae bacterium IMCC14734]|uniref:TauD/TfdA family dioxygenase n=1 Tax=Candidatus Litorirhabdus singularis TaxID=2518993 RepID=A0ABT3TEB8_9GAMM|nr:TauD/TfdA family dioxygenase [Candidatus Litorirhabdus singularis]MCX2980535.1 TauD/TfdA family dioxygenase [Candidatus Litorirhabdus singularis]
MKVTPFSENCGAVLSGIQLSETSDADIESLRELLAEHGLLFFREQDLPPQEHERFARRFGEIVLNKFFKPVENFPSIATVSKSEKHETNIGGAWHTDHSYDEEPALGSILVARNLPSKGGNTQFANMYAAYQDLSDGLKKTLESLRAVHSNVHIYGKDGLFSKSDIADTLGGTDRVGNATHPVVISHPDSGKKALYVNPVHTIHFEGWTPEESRPLLDYLYQHTEHPKYTCSFNWQPGSVAFWDNRSTWHLANNDYHGEARLMHRITLAGSPLASVSSLL